MAVSFSSCFTLPFYSFLSRMTVCCPLSAGKIFVILSFLRVHRALRSISEKALNGLPRSMLVTMVCLSSLVMSSGKSKDLSACFNSARYSFVEASFRLNLSLFMSPRLMVKCLRPRIQAQRSEPNGNLTVTEHRVYCCTEQHYKLIGSYKVQNL